jgi:hypothetical protein
MDAYSEDLRQKIVQALQQRRMNKSEAARMRVVILYPFETFLDEALDIVLVKSVTLVELLGIVTVVVVADGCSAFEQLLILHYLFQ